MINYKEIINNLNLDKISVKSVEEKKDHTIITIYGGLNGFGDIFFYLYQVDRIVCELSADKKDVWLISWENDCADDVWYLKLGVRDTKRKQTLLDSINNFSKAREAFVMKYLFQMNLLLLRQENIFQDMKLYIFIPIQMNFVSFMRVRKLETKLQKK